MKTVLCHNKSKVNKSSYYVTADLLYCNHMFIKQIKHWL